MVGTSLDGRKALADAAALSPGEAAAGRGGVTRLTGDHLAQALRLSQDLDWPYRAEDWAFALDLGNGLAIETDGRLAGTALWWPYGADHASTGMIIVAAQVQRQGIGARLMAALLGDTAGRTIILNSTSEGKALYTRLGFVPYGTVHQHQAVLGKAPSADTSVPLRAAEPSDRAALLAIDQAGSGMNRATLLDAIVAMADVLVVERGGCITGYGCVRRWGRGVVIGPVVAQDAADARALIATLAGRHVGQFVRIDVTMASGLSAWLESIGLPLVSQVVSMSLGAPPRVDPATTLFALANQSLG